MGKDFEPSYPKNEDYKFLTYDYANSARTSSSLSKEQEQVQECERLKEQAINEGRAEGLAQAQEEINKIKQELIEWISIVQKPVQLIDDKLTQEMIQTLVWLSQYCIGVELTVHPDKLRDLFNCIIEELPSLQGDKMFAMHPDDVEWVKANIALSEVPGLHDALVADSALDHGDFYLKSEHSELDGRLHTRLITLFSKYLNKDNLITPIESQD